MSKDALAGKKLGGTNVKEELFDNGGVLYHMFEPKLEYAWDNGIAIGAYLKGLKDGKILASYCPKCKRTMIPVRSFCELCWCNTDGIVEVADTGTIQTFSIARINYDASRLKPGEEPTVPAVIALDCPTEKMGLMHVLGGLKPEEYQIGMRVQAVWKPAAERKGDITDIMYFKPIK